MKSFISTFKTKLSVFVLFACAACNTSDFELDRLAGPVDWEPEVIAPVAQGDFSIWKLISSSSSIEKNTYEDEDDIIHFVYSENDVYSMDISDLVTFVDEIVIPPFTKNIPSATIQSFASTSVSYDIESMIDFEVDDETKGFAANMSNFGVDINLDFTFQFDGTATVIFPSIITEDGNIFSTDISIVDGIASTDNISISDCRIDLTQDPAQEYNRLPINFHVEMDNATSSPSGAKMEVDLTFNILDFETLECDLGNREVEIEGEDTHFSIDLDFFEDLDGTLTLIQPQLSLQYENGVGVPLALAADFIGYNKDGSSVSLNPDELHVSAPTLQNPNPISDSLFYDRENSNIVDFMSSIPDDQIVYDGKLRFNPENGVDKENPNFVSTSAKINMGVNVDIPMILKTEGISFRDTMEIDVDASDLKNTSLYLSYSNNTALNLDVNLLFVDTLTRFPINNMEPIEVGLMESGTTTAEGRANGSTEGAIDILLDDQNLENLSEANGVVFQARIISQSDGLQPSIIASTDSLGISFSLKATLDGEEL